MADILTIKPGKQVTFRGKTLRISRVHSINELELIDELTREKVIAPIAEVRPCTTSTQKKRRDLAEFDDRKWQLMMARFKSIKPLLENPHRTRADVAASATAANVSVPTLYRWLRDYNNSGCVSALARTGRRDAGQSRLSEAVEVIIKDVIESEYLSQQRRSMRMVTDEVSRRCLKAGLSVPHPNTVRSRLKSLSPELVAKRRKGPKAAQRDFRPIKGKFPGADGPLAVVQIDHTVVDIILVDDNFRRPIGRPTITLAFDVFSRMVTGFYVSFDPPSALSTGLCLSHAILPKEKWLFERKIDGEWPICGLPRKLHVDNAKEFRGTMLTRACQEYHIDIEWRPVGQPGFGGHIERALGTFSKEIHGLAGSTFSNVRDKGDYDAVRNAAMTLSEFETWLTNYIVCVYHLKMHSGIGTTPMAMFRHGVMGDEHTPGWGLPPRVADEQRLKIDLMPLEERTVQDYGVVIDGIHYYDDILRPWINATDPQDSKRKRKLLFRRDPRDLSQLWFYDPTLAMYFPIRYRDTSHPPMSIWELREARRVLREDGRANIDEHAIFEALLRMRQQEEDAKAKTKKALRSQQRRQDHRAQTATEAPSNNQPSVDRTLPTDREVTTTTRIIKPFDDLGD
ncbi:MAG: transposase [Gammaproteobacteria bacterium]|nr:transposase [Gammaproteobacteria bacterium]